jgi:hypothetical protein
VKACIAATRSFGGARLGGREDLNDTGYSDDAVYCTSEEWQYNGFRARKANKMLYFESEIL